MKAEEICIGNWLSHNEKWSTKNKDLNPFEFQFSESDWYYIGESLLDMDNINPIPLTEDWLIKFGFDPDKDNSGIYQYCLSLNDASICFYTRDNKMEGRINPQGYEADEIHLKHIKNVHQLQNLYFALTGNELTIITKP